MQGHAEIYMAKADNLLLMCTILYSLQSPPPTNTPVLELVYLTQRQDSCDVSLLRNQETKA